MTWTERLLVAIAIAGIIATLAALVTLRVAICRQGHPQAPSGYCWWALR